MWSVRLRQLGYGRAVRFRPQGLTVMAETDASGVRAPSVSGERRTPSNHIPALLPRPLYSARSQGEAFHW